MPNFDDNCREDSPVLSVADITVVKSTDTERQSGALAVQRAFATAGKVKIFNQLLSWLSSFIPLYFI